MIIHITDELTYDTAKKFEEQAGETQNYLCEIMENEPQSTEYDRFSRPYIQRWSVNGSSLLCTWVYFREEYNWVLKEQIFKMEEGYEC